MMRETGVSNGEANCFSVTEQVTVRVFWWGSGKALDYSVNKEVKNNNGRILILDVEIQGKPYLIINLYADNDQAGQLVTLAKLESLLESFGINDERRIILGGNFNIIFDTHLDADGDPLVSK